MNLNAYESKGFFTSRLYLSTVNEGKIENAVKTEEGKELKGAGSTSYGKIAGFFLSKLGLATKLELNKKVYYLNNWSFCEFIIRETELEENDKVIFSIAVGELNKKYKEHKKSPYKNISKVNKEFKKFVADKKGVIKDNDLSDLIGKLEEIAKIKA